MTVTTRVHHPNSDLDHDSERCPDVGARALAGRRMDRVAAGAEAGGRAVGLSIRVGVPTQPVRHVLLDADADAETARGLVG
ncbi:hypothetical protein, partial [Streptomyces sp. NPDC058728]|uniref:hypothetical protein n=1 Tax=Streptomyces sp. NPDC058728 TaxID=3346612 RepID=UPI0036882FD2